MMTTSISVRTYIVSFIFLLAIVYTAYIPSQSDFSHIILPYTSAFLCYLVLIYNRSNKSQFVLLIGLAILARFILIFSFPNLSDDIYRFSWDGRCIHLGISPYAYLPSEIVGQYPGLQEELYDQLNSPHYYSIYPPIGQFIGYIATFIKEDIYLQSIVFKSFLFISELGTFYFAKKIMQHLQLSMDRILLYALNPLIIIEIMGNIHFEGFMIVFLSAGLFYLLTNKNILSAGSMALSICSKLLPLMFLPLFWVVNGRKRGLIYNLLIGISALFLFIPLIEQSDLFHFQNSLDLYVRKFEFNGGIYYFIRWIGYWIKGYNVIHVIGPILSLTTIISILGLAYKYSRSERKSSAALITVMLFSFTAYLLFATTVHPWYLSTIIFLCIFTQFRFPVLWSLLIFFTYINYSYTPYFENLFIVLLEYSILYSYLIYEWKYKIKTQVSI